MSMRLFAVVTERGVGSLVFELTKMFHETLSYAASCFADVGGCVVGAVVTGNFVHDIFNMTFPCQPCFAGVAGAAARGARWGL